MKANIRNKFYFFNSSFFILFFTLNINAQRIFLLSDRNLEGYELVRENSTFWLISNDSLTNNVIEQKWRISENNEYYINYCEFENEIDAIKGTAYNANSNAMPFIFGSSTGEIIGNISWVSLDGSATYFQKGNVGVKIFNPKSYNNEDKKNILYLSNKVLSRINENIYTDNKTNDEESSKYLPYEQFNKIIERSEKLISKYGYTEYKIEKSKWFAEVDNFLIGYRKQWSKNQSIFSIDIALLSDNNDALRVSEFRSKISLSPICMLDNDESILAAIDEWMNKWSNLDKLNYISIVGTRGNISMLFYYHNNYGIDSKTVYEILKSL